MNMRLLIMRHAEAENSSLVDFNRTLSPNGLEEAKKAAVFLQDHQIDKIISSYVKRTMQTSNIIMQDIPAIELEMVTEFYEGTIEEIFELLSQQSDLHKNILLVGHNPLIHQLVLSLTSKEDRYYSDVSDSTMETAQLIMIEFPELFDWQNIKPGSGNIIEIFIPDKNYK
ncbi:MAG TPA: histidine phosphatase family protein [Candidatus Megaira endosymbiont of Nemacystus decipiens]|nr:histidine phosphatase family protein [Candidatus Megaera endosymbiont of Nemacystus decipiens]